MRLPVLIFGAAAEVIRSLRSRNRALHRENAALRGDVATLRTVARRVGAALAGVREVRARIDRMPEPADGNAP